MNDDLKEQSLFWDRIKWLVTLWFVLEGLVTLAVIIGIIVAFCFVMGYYWHVI